MSGASTPDLRLGEVEILGRIMPASNQTFFGELVQGELRTRIVYKPVAGERPLWDFVEGTLANREYAAWVVSDTLGWSVVPPTVLRDGPAGPGMVQLWCEPTEGADPVDLVPQGEPPPGYLHVLDAYDGRDHPIALVHEDCLPLRRMAVFDVVTNNTDRKGGHVLAMADGHRYGVDHGICFHTDDKLRTVLWGFAGLRLDETERRGLERVIEGLTRGGDLTQRLGPLLTRAELARTRLRAQRLLEAGRMPSPDRGWPAIPWPPF